MQQPKRVAGTGGCSAEGWGLSAAERRGSVSPMGTSAHGARRWLALKTRLQTRSVYRFLSGIKASPKAPKRNVGRTCQRLNGRFDPWGWAASAVAGLSCHLCSGSVIRCLSWLVGVKKCPHRVIPNLSALDLKPRATGLSLLHLEEGCMC